MSIVALAGRPNTGKTSVSASLAILAARAGKKVLVLTIDPSKRLAQTLGIDPEKEEIKEIPSARWRKAGAAKTNGALYGMVINPKTIFDEVVRRFSHNQETAETILNNAIYQHLSSILAGSQDYMAMEKLLDLYEHNPIYDLIILDTPPSQHALDFLDAPQKMVRAISDSALKYFLKPGLFLGRSGFRILRRGPKIFLSMLDKIAGVQFLEEISELLILAQGLFEGFKERAEAVETLLRSPQTGFCMVSTLSPWSTREAVSFYETIAAKGIILSGIFLNRTVPAFTWNLSRKEVGALPPEIVAAGDMAFTIYNSIYQREQQEEATLRNTIESAQLPVWKLPLLPEEIHDLETLKKMAEMLE